MGSRAFDRSSACVIIPALNEAAVIGLVVAELLDVVNTPEFPVDVSKILVVDNGSDDETAIVAQQAGACVVRESQRGFGRACLTGVEHSGEVDLLIFLDGDGSDCPADIDAILQPILDSTAELTVGSRIAGSFEPGSLTQSQRFGNWLVGNMLGRVYGVQVSDVGPFRAVRKADLLELKMAEMTYGWPVEMLARAGRQGLRVQSVPVSWRNRAGGESKVSGNLMASIRTGFRFMAVFARVR